MANGELHLCIIEGLYIIYLFVLQYQHKSLMSLKFQLPVEKKSLNCLTENEEKPNQITLCETASSCR